MTQAGKVTRVRVPVGGSDAGARLDRFLAGALPDLSRTRLKGLIEQGRVTACGVTIADPSYRVKPGQILEVAVPPAAPAAPAGEAIALDVVYEDEHLIVIDKPAGMVVHPAPGSPRSTLVNALIAHCGDTLSGVGGVLRPGIVHRLDKDTSGLMVVAKTDAAHAGLAAQFESRAIRRAYTAVVWGLLRPRSGEIAGAIGRDPRNRKRMAVVSRGGKPAVTRYRVVRHLDAVASLVECRLLTGRTHQIRVHLASRGHPVIGDRTYARAPARRLKGLPPAARAVVADFHRLALHAHLIGFAHPATGQRLEFSSPLPHIINDLIGVLESI